jgi:hypothetical protein
MFWNPMPLLNYFANLAPGRNILWCYVIWWAVMVQFYFRPEVRLWVMSLGIALIVGYALMLCTGPVSMSRFRQRFWESLRLFICPLMVSSFSALVTGEGFLLVFSSRWQENSIAVLSVLTFLVLERVLKQLIPAPPA